MRRPRGQAAVETALTMPLVLFMVLGTMQLFSLLQTRILAQYALGRATRLSSLNYASCEPMRDTMLTLMTPALNAGFARSPTSPNDLGEKFRDSARAYISTNRFDGREWSTPYSVPGGRIVDLERRVFARGSIGQREEEVWNLPEAERTLEVRLVFWAPLKIPFADWVFQRIALANWNVSPYTFASPYMPATKNANWGSSGSTPMRATIATELSARYARGERVFPVTATRAMRMLSPPRVPLNAWATCP